MRNRFNGQNAFCQAPIGHKLARKKKKNIYIKKLFSSYNKSALKIKNGWMEKYETKLMLKIVQVTVTIFFFYFDEI